MRRCDRAPGARIAAVRPGERTVSALGGRIAAALTAAMTVSALAAGCTVTGSPAAQWVDPASLDVGAYSVEPLDVPRGDSARHGRVLESARMTEALIDPVEADPALRVPIGGAAMTPLPTPAKATTLLAAPVRAALERHGMLAGAAVGGSDRQAGVGGPAVGSARVLTVIVLRFPDADAATRAAREIDAVDAAVSPDNAPVPIPNHSTAHAHWRPGVPTLAASVAHESFVVSLLAGHTAPDLGALTTLAGAAFDRQLARLREFAPTPRDRFAELPLDPEGMISRMVPQAPGRWEYPAVTSTSKQRNAGWDAALHATGVVYGPRAAYLWGSRKRPGTAEAIGYSGFNLLARYPDPAAARDAFTIATRQDADNGLRPIPGPDRLDDVRCAENPEPDALGMTRFICRVLYGRYYAAIAARELGSARQKAAAQYGLLVNGG
ncbi:DUF7373 family lipoprotein [Nocardia bhagyanarayanae]|uniref:Uncharacterized protein n=1 Tax=Nocardia bhagyanarayanae TaxID=1215925 RepID=A0A543FEQ4_9NOCA|nr:hypothetical protein [Nocardia bhagyanarayanae]TQM32251.1 hypothetical protein FB390_3929 [Nocardia bhagyanarayanae]